MKTLMMIFGAVILINLCSCATDYYFRPKHSIDRDPRLPDQTVVDRFKELKEKNIVPADIRFIDNPYEASFLSTMYDLEVGSFTIRYSSYEEYETIVNDMRRMAAAAGGNCVVYSYVRAWPYGADAPIYASKGEIYKVDAKTLKKIHQMIKSLPLKAAK
jgi:hypothetical protein